MNSELMTYLPVLAPVILIELLLMVTAVIHIVRHKSFRFGNMPVWLCIVVFLQIIGPVLYFTIGRGDEM